MGHKDLVKLHLVYSAVQSIAKMYGWHFQFKVDDGNFETAIIIGMDGEWKLPGPESMEELKAREFQEKLFCPDLIDYYQKLIIEYEELAKPNTGYLGAKMHKGHTDYTNSRDTIRDAYYNKAGFNVLKIFENELKDESWKAKLRTFLESSQKSSS